MMDSRYCIGEYVVLGDGGGVIVDGQVVVGGGVEFSTAEGTVEGTVLKAEGPELVLNGAQVWLVQEKAGGELQPRYALMVDDVYWGLRIQPAEFTAPPFSETFVMGYRLCGVVLADGVAIPEANVSLEVALTTAEDGGVVLWDSEEYNELVYSAELETWVEGPDVLAPIRTDEDGEWEFVAPKGHGAIYQREQDRRDAHPRTLERIPTRYVSSVSAMYRGHRAAAEEGTSAVINVDSSGLNITGTPGAHIRVGPMDSSGNSYLMPPSGEIELSGLTACEYAIVQFKRNAWGNWDSTWGCPRQTVTLEAGATSTVVLAPMEEYPLDDDVVVGRVYERPGVAASVDIVIIDMETYELVGTAASTGGGGFWSAEIPEEGFGGDLFIHDPYWGSVPVLGSPYSDICLGARAYSCWFDEFRPEAWRKGSLGHKNFPYIPKSIWVEDPVSGEEFETDEAAYGGWKTVDSLPKFRYVADLQSLVEEGPQFRTYDLVDAEGVLETGFILGSQPFAGWETPPGLYRASGYYPEAKLLLGGKTHGNVVFHGQEVIDEAAPEAARFGLEFGALDPYMEIRCGPGDEPYEITSFTGLLCPYCGGAAHRDPSPGAAARGYCVQCAGVFGNAKAMDCRTHYRSPAMGAGDEQWQRVVARACEESIAREFKYHWRPDVYDETDDFITQSGAGQPTNAPRWFAQHVDAFGDGAAFGRFDGDASPPYLPGHEISYFSALPEIDRDLGLVQLKLVFEPGYQLPSGLTVDVDCVLDNGEIETHRATMEAGLRGPGGEDPFGDAVRITDVAKGRAELLSWPYEGTGFYRGIADIRLVAPTPAAGCRFTVVADAPFLASPLGIPVTSRVSTPVALQVGRSWGNPHLMADSVGQVFLTHARDGNIHLHRRRGIVDDWDEGEEVVSDGVSDYPWTGKDARGTLVLVRQRGHSTTELQLSRDDGRNLEE